MIHLMSLSWYPSGIWPKPCHRIGPTPSDEGVFLLLHLRPPEAIAEQRYLFVLTPLNRRDLLTAPSLKDHKRCLLAQWFLWRHRYPDQWTPLLTHVPFLTERFLAVLQTKPSKTAQQLAQVILQDDDAQRNLDCLTALDIFEDKWNAYIHSPAVIPFAHQATFVLAGWHAIQQTDRAFQHEAHGHAAKKKSPYARPGTGAARRRQFTGAVCRTSQCRIGTRGRGIKNGISAASDADNRGQKVAALVRAILGKIALIVANCRKSLPLCFCLSLIFVV